MNYTLPFMGLLNDPLSFLLGLAMKLPVIILALTVHEFAHALVAYKLGDNTAKYLGRLTLNPIKHIDPVGIAMLAFLGMGYARPVPVNPRNFKNPRRDDFLVSIAGITTNLIMFAISYIISFVIIYSIYKDFIVMGYMKNILYYRFDDWWLEMILLFVQINAVLAIFNLLPIPPLDGFHVFNDLFLKRSLFATERVSQIGTAIMIFLLVSGKLGEFISFCLNFMLKGMYNLCIQVFRLFNLL